MPCMTVGMVEATRRKTRFLTVGTDITTKAKPPSAATAFCIYFITIIGAINNREKAKEKPTPPAGPIPAFSNGKANHITTLNSARRSSRPLGRVREGLTISCFFTANGGLFERPKAAF